MRAGCFLRHAWIHRGAGAHDGGPGEMDDYRAALDFIAAKYPGRPLWAAGYSFGSWIAWNTALDDERVALLLGLGLPVNLFDFTPVKAIDTAKFLIHGDRDEVIPLRDIRRFYAIARGSAMECGALVDVCRVAGFLPPAEVQDAKTLLARIVAMLTRMCRG